MYIWVDKCTTWCPNTPANWENFRKRKEGILNGTGMSNNLLDRLKKQANIEGKFIRRMRTYLPGYEPDR